MVPQATYHVSYLRWSAQWLIFIGILFLSHRSPVMAQRSVAHAWNEVALEAVRHDFARPTVHARNLFHLSAAMYDAWAVYDEVARPYFLGHTRGGMTIDFDDGLVYRTEDNLANQQEALSFAAYRLLKHRFKYSPGASYSTHLMDSLMIHLGYDTLLVDTDYGQSPAMLGNYIAEQIIAFGYQDGSHEAYDYQNLFYLPGHSYLDGTIDPVYPGNPNLKDPNRWQPIRFGSFIDQSGNPIPTEVPEFLGAEWGMVTPFSLEEKDKSIHRRNGVEYWVYHDPGPPPYLTTGMDSVSEFYRWNFVQVLNYSSQLDAEDDEWWDISPKGFGNRQEYPEDMESYKSYYEQANQGVHGPGHRINPSTGKSYESQWVRKGDYTRVLAEFWADGPDSETPPGHWFTILNTVNDHPFSTRKLGGVGESRSALEWDVLSYFALGGAMHDAAIAAWSIKGWYDYIRPLSAIRYMADQGQSSDSSLSNYHPHGLPLIPGLIEVISDGDSLVQARDSVGLVGTLKIKTWRGHNLDYIPDSKTSTAGVGWIPAGEWWSYQRSTFVTPPFAGYVSGHSTFSRAAAELMTALTGDPFFPGGMGVFKAEKNNFLLFEQGPTQDIELQWATYVDASDQTSLSRIWGGIHPPADDMVGRKIGEKIGKQAYQNSLNYIEGSLGSYVSDGTSSANVPEPDLAIYPNPVAQGEAVKLVSTSGRLDGTLELYSILGQRLLSTELEQSPFYHIPTHQLASGVYYLLLRTPTKIYSLRFTVVI